MSCLNDISGIKVVAEASDVLSARAKLEIYSPNILVTDLSLPGESGFELVQWSKKFNPDLVVVVISMHTELQFVQQAKDLGAAGFLAKEDAEFELMKILAQSNDDFYTSQSIGSHMVRDLPDLDAIASDKGILKNISAAEMRVLQLLSQSLTSKSISEELNISPRTVEAHRRRISEKLDLKGPNRLIEFAITNRKFLASRGG